MLYKYVCAHYNKEYLIHFMVKSAYFQKIINLQISKLSSIFKLLVMLLIILKFKSNNESIDIII